MIKIGVTGGIGSGKSVVSEIFHLHGFPLYNADLEAKRLNDSSPIIREQLIQQFGEDLYCKDTLDRKKLASIIFHDPEKLAIANSIIHPQLAIHFAEWCRQQDQQPVVVMDAALLIEAGFQQVVDKVIVISAPKELRTERVMQRDGLSRYDVEARMESQLPEDEKMQYADYVIINDNRRSLIKQVSDMINLITQK